MRLISWNVNGIRAVAKKGFLDWFNEDKPDVLGVQEIKAMPEQVPAEVRAPKGYEVHWNSAERKGYSGVATFTKKKPLSVMNGFGTEKFDIEGRSIMLEFDEFYFSTYISRTARPATSG